MSAALPSSPCVAEASLAARRLGERRRGLERRSRDRGEHELRDSIASAHDVGPRAEIDEKDLDLPSVVRVDRSGRVRHADRVARGETAPSADLTLVPWRDLEANPSRDREHLPRPDLGLLLEGGHQVHSRRVLRLVGRRRDGVSLEEDADLDLIRHATAPGTRSEDSKSFSVLGPSATRQRRSRERISLATRRTSSPVIRSTEAISSSTET